MKKFFLILLFLLLGSVFSGARAVENVSTSQLASVIINDSGRLKPLETYAKYYLLRLSGRTSYKGLSATDWLARAMFKPDSVFADKVFLINNPEILEAIGVKPDAKRRYSFSDLEQGEDKLSEFAQIILEKEEKQRTNFDKEIIRVFFNYQSLIQTFDTFSLFMTHPDFQIYNPETQKNLGLSQSQNSVFDLLQVSSSLHEQMSDIQKLTATQAFNFAQQDVLRLSVSLYRWLEGHKEFQQAFLKSEKLLFIPISQNQWLSPWEQFNSTDKIDKQELFALQKIYQAYHSKNQKDFDSGLEKYKNLIDLKLNALKINKPQVALELIYNRIKPFSLAQFLYLFSLIWTIIAFIKKQSTKLPYILYSALACHAFGILARVLILQRAPVSNLYESFIFVAFISALVGLVISLAYKKSFFNPGIFLANISGFLLLLISSKFAVEGDTMQVLIAVLNSNFWLSTHVICITIGYAGTFSAGLIGHIYLFQKSFLTKNTSSADEKLTIMIYAVLGFGLCFSFLGTMLGGIWADQSWGRFWGWDPKENGALLIVLWTATVFHARIAGLIKEDGLAIGSVIGGVVVMISWFGINLLGVGLHSYGFTSGVASYLLAYFVFEILFLGAFWLNNTLKLSKNP